MNYYHQPMGVMQTMDVEVVKYHYHVEKMKYYEHKCHKHAHHKKCYKNYYKRYCYHRKMYEYYCKKGFHTMYGYGPAFPGSPMNMGMYGYPASYSENEQVRESSSN